MNMPAACTLLPQRVPIAAEEVQVWHAPLDVSPSEVARLEYILAPDELFRASRFRYATDRQRFVTCRGRLREMLSRYLGESPREIELCYGPHGKPQLKPADGSHPLRFNVSHSAGLGAFAFSLDREVGIDIEHFQVDFAWEDIARSLFSAEEVSVMQSLPVSDRYVAFLSAWTCREARAKARGDGLAHAFERSETAEARGESGSSITLRDVQEASRWTVTMFIPQAGYAAALAVEGTGGRMICGHWGQ
jgi:4'-phosphopantetheinyl transferase